MDDLNTITAFLAVCTMALVARGFLPIASPRKPDILGHLVAGATILCAATILRMTYWDLIGVIVSRDLWLAWTAATGGKTANVIPNGLVLWASYHFLRARYLLIPESDRENWNIFTAVFYPARKCIAVHISKLRAKK